VSGVAEADLVEVRLVGLSVPDWAAARQHNEELNREFALLLAQAAASPGSVPDRLLAMTAELRAEYANYTATPTAELEAALTEGRPTVDLTFRVPASAGAAAETLGQLLDEADRYCAEGALLTLATPARAKRLRDWYLGEFVRQTGGAAPTPYEPVDVATT
jgi:hypothetical protein